MRNYPVVSKLQDLGPEPSKGFGPLCFLGQGSGGRHTEQTCSPSPTPWCFTSDSCPPLAFLSLPELILEKEKFFPGESHAEASGGDLSLLEIGLLGEIPERGLV